MFRRNNKYEANPKEYTKIQLWDPNDPNGSWEQINVRTVVLLSI